MKTNVSLTENGFIPMLSRFRSSSMVDSVVAQQLLNDCLDREEGVDLNVLLGHPGSSRVSPLAMILNDYSSFEIMSKPSKVAVVQDPLQEAWPLNEKEAHDFEYKNIFQSKTGFAYPQVDYLSVRMLWRGADPWLKEKDEPCGMDYFIIRDMGSVLDLHFKMHPERAEEFSQKLMGSPCKRLGNTSFETWWHYLANSGLTEIAKREFEKGFDFSGFELNKSHPLLKSNYPFLSLCLDYGLVPADNDFIYKIEESLRWGNSKGTIEREELLEILERFAELKGEVFDPERTSRYNYLSELRKLNSGRSLEDFEHVSLSWDELIEIHHYGKKNEKVSILGEILEKAWNYKVYDLPLNKIWKDFKNDSSLLDHIDALENVKIKENCLWYLCQTLRKPNAKAHLSLGTSNPSKVADVVVRNFNKIENMFENSRGSSDREEYVSALNTSIVWGQLKSYQREKVFEMLLKTPKSFKQRLDMKSCPPDIEKNSREHQIWKVNIALMTLRNHHKAFKNAEDSYSAEFRAEYIGIVRETNEVASQLLESMTIKDLDWVHKFSKNWEETVLIQAIRDGRLLPFIALHQKSIDLIQSLELNEKLIPAQNKKIKIPSENRF